MKKLLITVASTACIAASLAMVPATAQAGAAWGKCQACHSFGEQHKVGPALKGVVGRAAGKSGFTKHSKSLKNANWTWSEENLRAWICNSKKAVKALSGDEHAKTKMPPQKICDPAKQDEVIAKLKSL